MSFLRLTPPEYQAITHVCRPLALPADLFPDFKCFLIVRLLDAHPALARRIALLRPGQLRLLFNHLRERQRAGGDPIQPEELQQLARACETLVLPHRLAGFYKDFLVRYFKGACPRLAKKLDRLSPEQFRDLYARVRERRP